MAELSETQKLFVVMSLATFKTPSQVVAALKQDFGVVVKPQNITVYDPNHVTGKRLSQELKDTFRETRRAYLEDAETIPIKNQLRRLRVLDDLLVKALTGDNARLAMDILKQAAEECGGKYTNTNIHEFDFHKLTDEALIERAKGLLGGAGAPGADA